MHISDSLRRAPNTILTKCSKMTTEERHRRHGMNGNAADGGPKEECPKVATCAQGGRLKFFKDGKFILELERAREGERVSWVSVPRKTFWPPQGTAASTPTYRQESSTSLSVSDDNSSIQSSPWQRDHSWKQSTPRRYASREMTFYFWHPRRGRFWRRRSRKRRRPYSTAPEEYRKVRCSNSGERTTPKESGACNNNGSASAAAVQRQRGIASVAASGRMQQRPSLLVIVQALLERTASAGTPPPPRSEVVVSPRKRFLREMEKDNKIPLEEGGQKRSRNRPAPQTVATAMVVQAVAKVASPVRVNGTSTAAAAAPAVVTAAAAVAAVPMEEPTSAAVPSPTAAKPQRNCSYSITSLLAEDRNIRRSPNNSPSHFSPVTQPQSQYCSPSSSEDRWYSESVDRLRSIELSQADKRGYSSYPPHSYLPYMYQYPLPPFYNPNMYGRGYIVPSTYPPPPMQLALRHDSPSCSWAMEPPRDSENRDENITDMPLNLSKHAG